MREKLVLALAEAIAVACEGQRVTYANAKRLVTRDFLTAFHIRRETEYTTTEFMKALKLAQEERALRSWDGLPLALTADRQRIRSVFDRSALKSTKSG